MNVPENLKYSEDHEWIRIEGDVAFVGITDYAQSKAVEELYLPITGEVLEFNEELEDSPDLVNKDPYDKGWVVKIKITDPGELDDLLDSKAYTGLIQ